MNDTFGEVWEDGLIRRAAACGLKLTPSTVSLLGTHARAVLQANAELHLTSITDPGVFLERHIGEAFEGAAMLPPVVEGPLLDLGSGNGYPGLPFAAVLPGLRLLMVEASPRKCRFLERTVELCAFDRADVLEAQIQRASDLFDLGPFRCIVTRAMGGWERILPRLASTLETDGEVLLWCGAEPERVVNRSGWGKLRLVERKALPGRDRSWIWRFRRSGPS